MPPSHVYTVSQITAYIKALLTEDEILADVWLSGEVSGFTVSSAGHCYFTLKDAGAVLKAVIWRSQAARMALPRNGDQVLAHGYISVYEQGGAYQFYVDRLEAAGTGRLWLEFERLKARLGAEGLFDPARKRPIPPRPRRLGVVTSPTGAALRDILRTLSTRYPLTEVLLAATPVQGAEAPAGIVDALQALNRWSAEQEPLDVILLARGGGSIEELWAFNDERVARAIAASAVPVITGIGHEIDFTIADFVADLRAATPTAAATLATPDIRQLRAGVGNLAAAAHARMAARLRAARTALTGLQTRAARLSSERQFAQYRQRIDELQRRSRLAITNRLAGRRTQLEGLRLQLAALDPTAVLARGYAIVSKVDGAVISSTAQVSPGDDIHVRVADGGFGATVQAA